MLYRLLTEKYLYFYHFLHLLQIPSLKHISQITHGIFQVSQHISREPASAGCAAANAGVEQEMLVVSQ